MVLSILPTSESIIYVERVRLIYRLGRADADTAGSTMFQSCAKVHVVVEGREGHNQFSWIYPLWPYDANTKSSIVGVSLA